MTTKRTTAEEKRQLLLSFFKASEDVYQLKELEKVASKANSVPMNSIKDTLQQLVDDDQVQSDKVGNQTYYWLFKSKASKDKQIELKELEEKLEKRQNYLNDLEDKLSKIDPTDFENTDDKKATLDELKEKYQTMEKQLNQNDKQEDIGKTVSECNDWTENLYLIRRYVADKMNMDANRLDQEFGIPKDMDFF